MSIIDLSVESDVSERTIYQIESGEVNVSLKTLVNIAEALGIETKKLIE